MLSDLGVRIDRTRPSLVAPNTFNEKYLRSKASRMAHSLDLGAQFTCFTSTKVQILPQQRKKSTCVSAQHGGAPRSTLKAAYTSS
jgi:hypothetical protein